LFGNRADVELKILDDGFGDFESYLIRDLRFKALDFYLD
jgi:hypothetical protein